jgi:tetratricopeptide (TPR) repeat protein
MKKFKNQFGWVLLFSILWGLRLEASINEQIYQAKQILKRGYDIWNPDTLKTARSMFLNIITTLSEEEKELTCLAYYYLALTDYRLTAFYMKTDIKEAKKYNQEGIKYLQEVMKMFPSFGETYALYATMLGNEIAFNPMKGMTLGPESNLNFEKAFEKNSKNPRIYLLKGISDFYTPSMYGGGPDNAISFLNKAIELFENEIVKDSLYPEWGHEEAYVYLGLCYKQKKEYSKAREAFNNALKVNPQFGWAIGELHGLPEESK